MSQTIIQKHLAAEAVSPEDGHCFFGYFDKFATDENDGRILVHKVDFTARQPRLGDKALIGVIDLESRDFTPVAETPAWNWQQGSMLQWFSRDSIMYNDLEGDTYVARIHNLATGARRTLSRPLYCLSPDRKWGLSLNFIRLDRERPGYGYSGLYDPTMIHGYPDSDGIWLVDIERNRSQLVVSLGQMTRLYPREGMDHAVNWFNHMLINPDGTRFAFFHRWRVFGPWGPGICSHLTHMFTANLDGSGIYPLNLDDFSSHYTWVSPERIINYSNRRATGNQYHLFTDRSERVEVVGQDVFPGDGHCSFSPDGKWMLSDTYPQKEDSCRRLYLYDLERRQTYEIGRFYADLQYPGPTRCDLHPRWFRNGRMVSFDSIHEHRRKLYVMDVSEIIDR